MDRKQGIFSPGKYPEYQCRREKKKKCKKRQEESRALRWSGRQDPARLAGRQPQRKQFQSAASAGLPGAHLQKNIISPKTKVGTPSSSSVQIRRVKADENAKSPEGRCHNSCPAGLWCSLKGINRSKLPCRSSLFSVCSASLHSD